MDREKMVTISDLLKELFTLNQHVSAAVVLDMKGKVLSSNGGPWTIDGVEVAKSLSTGKLPALTIQGIKYSTLQHDEVKYVGSNMQGKGHVVGARSGSNAWLLTYIAPQGDKQVGYRDVFNIAQKMKAIL